MINFSSGNLRRFVLAATILMVIGAQLIVTRPVAAASGSIFFSPAGGSFTVGSIVTINVKENSGSESVNAALATVVYPVDKFEFVDVISSPAFSVPIQLPVTDGIVPIGRGALRPVSDTQTIASIRFKVINTGTATLSFESETFLLMSGQALITDSSIDGTYTLKTASSQVSNPSLSTSTSKPKPQSTNKTKSPAGSSKKITDPKVFFIRSDLNHSEYIDVFDLTILLNNYANKKNKGVDINKDGNINTIDLSVLLSNYST